VKIKNPSIPLGAREKANTWKIEKFRISVTGKIPEFEESITY